MEDDINFKMERRLSPQLAAMVSDMVLSIQFYRVFGYSSIYDHSNTEKRYRRHGTG